MAAYFHPVLVETTNPAMMACANMSFLLIGLLDLENQDLTGKNYKYSHKGETQCDVDCRGRPLEVSREN